MEVAGANEEHDNWPFCFGGHCEYLLQIVFEWISELTYVVY